MLAPSVHRGHLQQLAIFGDRAVRTGIYTGTCLGITFSVWVYLANRVPSLELFASQRNMAAAALLGLLAVIPTMRYFRDPGKMLIASLIHLALWRGNYGR